MRKTNLRASALIRLKLIRIAIYSRYSSKNQSRMSAKDQTNRALKLVGKKSIPFLNFPYNEYDFENVEYIFFSDEAKSGTRVGRAGYDAFKKCIELGECDVALVDDLSRIVRDLGEQMDFYHLLKYKGVELFSICDQISSAAPTAKVHFQIKGIANEMERDQNAARTRRGLEARVDRGFSCGDTCYGYRSQSTQERMQGGRSVPSHFEIYVEPSEAKVTNLIYDLYIKGVGLSAIAKELNRRQVPSTIRGQKITGKKVNWSGSTIRKILTNPKYIGVWQWGQTQTVYNPITQKKERKPLPKDQWLSHLDGKDIREDLVIVTRSKWDKVQEKFAESQKRYCESNDKAANMRSAKQIGSKSDSLLAGILRCGQCGAPMIQVTKAYYGCHMYHRKDSTKCSNKRMLSRKKIDRQVCQTITDTLMDPGLLNSATDILNKKIKDRLSSAPKELISLEKRKTTVSREIQNLLKFITQHGDSSPAIKDSLKEKEGEVDFLTQQILTLKSARADKLFVTPYALKQEFQKLSEHFESDPILANAALRKMIPSGLSCVSEGKTSKKNLNQNNSKWRVTGELAISYRREESDDSTPLIQPNLVGLETRF